MFQLGMFQLIVLLLNLNVILAKNDPKIVIVGAGAAGISAAVDLLEKGINDVTILEAENRIGGRIFSVKLGTDMVDLGAQYVVGEKGNPVWEMAGPLGLLAHSNDSLSTYHLFTADGQTLDIDKTKNLTKHIRTLFLNAINNKNNETFGIIAENEIDKYFAEHPDMENKEGFRHFLKQMISSLEYCDSWDEMFPENTEWGVEGDWFMNWKENSFSMILDLIMKKYPDPSKEIKVMEKVKLNSKVTKVDYTDDNEKVQISMKDGEIIEADDVIVTVSLGVLNANYKTLFEPQIPDNKKEVIENLGFGDGTTIYLLFENQWWNDNPKTNGFSFLWTEKEIAERKNNPDKEWQIDLLGFFKPAYRKNILQMYITGKGARQVELLSDDKLMEQIIELMQFFKENNTVQTPTKMIRSAWHSNKHFLGSGTFRNINSWKKNIKMNVLQEAFPKDKPKIWFAGEATDALGFGTVNGAINSGKREATKILQKYGKIVL